MQHSPENSARVHLRLIHGGADTADADSAAPARPAEEKPRAHEPGAALLTLHDASEGAETRETQRGASANAETREAQRGASANAETREAQRGASPAEEKPSAARGRGASVRRRRRVRRGVLAGRGLVRLGAGAVRRGMGVMRRGVLRLAPAGGEPASWVGRDFGEPRAQRAPRQRRWPGVLAGLVIAGLLLAGLRMAIVRERYLLGEAIQVETALRQRERAASVAVRELRDPRRLRRLALEAGFARPERAIELDPPAAKNPGGGSHADGGGPNLDRSARRGSADDTTGLGRRVEWLGR